jgi:DNA-binding NtrC family response regulator
MSIQRVLIVDDDSLSREFFTEACRTFGFQVETVTGAEQAFERLRRGGIDLVFADARLQASGGSEFCKSMAREFPEVALVLTAAQGAVELAAQGLHTGASDFVQKPCSPKTLEAVVRRLARLRRLEGENEYLRAEAGLGDSRSVVAESKTMRECLRTAERVAASKGTVLITGESGCGKERLARYLHHKSPRHTGPFVRVNCAALSEQELEAELFGYERGAFTGAARRRLGRLELADSGTLLVDEVAELTPAVQAKLLRVLEEGVFERLGGANTLHVDVRVVATTNRDMPEEVAQGRFREDLYYRLHVLPLHVAALRERSEDILPLARAFAAQHARENGIATPGFSPEAEKRLLEWHWPGNVRELENAVQRAVVLLEGATIEPDHLNFQLMPHSNVRPKFTLVTDKGHYLGAISANSPLANRPLSDLEREAILCTLEATRGNKTEAARRLQVTARTLSNKMKLWRQLGLVA